MKHIKAQILRLTSVFLAPDNDPYKFTLIGEQLYTKEAILVKNSRIHIVRKKYSTKIPHDDRVLINEDHYLLLLHVDNLAHFFHDIFFPLYVMWRTQPKKIFASISDNSFTKDFLIAVFGQENIYFADPKIPYGFLNITPTPEGRDLKDFPDYLNICNEIKQRCLSSLGIVELRNNNYLYGRNELARKNLLNIDTQFLQEHDIKSVALSKLSFKEVVALLSTAKSLIYMVGAGVFYLLFLDKNVQVLEINPIRNNSWAQMFGMDQLCRLSVLVSDNVQASEQPAQGDKVLDSHVYFDENIQSAIIKLLSHN